MKRTRRKAAVTILTNDPSLTAWGYAIININGKVLFSDAIKTKQSDKKRKIRKGDDRSRRLNELATRLNNAIDEYSVKYMLCELPHGSQNYNGAVMIGAVNGIMETLSVVKGIGIEFYTEADSKKAIKERNPVTKTEMVRLIKKKYKGVRWFDVKWRDEAMADAIAVFNVAVEQSPTLKYFKST